MTKRTLVVWTSLLLQLMLCCCSPKQEKTADSLRPQLAGEWLLHHVVRRQGQDPPSHQRFQDEPGYNANRWQPTALAFTGDSIEFLQGIFTFPQPNRQVYHGNFASYRLQGDSILWKNPAANTWQVLGMVRWIRNDTLLLATRTDPAVPSRPQDSIWEYYHKLPRGNPVAAYDEIVLSVAGSWGRYAAVTFARSGDLLYQNPREQSGVSRHQLTPYQRDLLFAKFERIDTATALRRTGAGIDGDVATTCLVRNHRIVARFRDWGLFPGEMNGAKELLWAYVPALGMPRTLRPLAHRLEPPFNQNLVFRSIARADGLLALETAEAFYLWRELYRSPRTSSAVALPDTLHFVEYTSHPAPNAPADPAHQLAYILTNGRYYRFCFRSGASTTCDLGYDFVARNGLARNGQR